MPTRRDFAISGGSLVAALALAGCADNGDDDDDDAVENGENGDDGLDDETGTNGENGDTDDDQYDDEGKEEVTRTEFLEYAEAIKATDERPLLAYGQHISTAHAVEDFNDGMQTVFGAEPDELGWSIDVNIAGVDNYGYLFGSMEYDAVRGEFEGQAEITELPDYRGYQGFEAQIQQQEVHYGVGSPGIVNANSPDLYTAAIDTVAEDTDLLVDTDEDFAAVVDRIEDPDIFFVELEPEDMDIDPSNEAVAGGASYQLAEEESEYTAVVVYESEEQASEYEDDVGQAVLDNEEAISDVETEVDGRVVIATGMAVTAEIQ